MSSQKRLLLVANVAKEHINKFHIPTIKTFRSHGWIVDVACSGDAEVPECNHQFYMSWKRSPFTLKTIKGIQELKLLLDETHYDAIYCHTPVGGLIARLASRKARKCGTKVIYCAHGFHFFKGAPLMNWLVYYPLEKWLAHFTDVVFTVNKEDYIRASKSFTKKTQVRLVPEVGVNFNRLIITNNQLVRHEYRKELNISDNTTALIYVAELIPNKNQKMLIDVVKLLLNEGEDVKLLLPGPDHYNGEIEKYVHSQNLDGFVITLGWRSDIGELMHAADICTASSIREGFGINLVEAMYCGLPVVATKNRGHEMVITDGDNGFLIPINDTEFMGKQIKLLIHDKEKYKRLSSINVDKYDCNLVAEQLYEAICREMNLF